MAEMPPIEFEVLLRRKGREATNLLGTVVIDVQAVGLPNEEMLAAGATESLKVDPQQVADVLIETAAKIRQGQRE